MISDPFAPVVPASEVVAASGPIDWKAVKAEIAARLDLKAEFAALGVVFTGVARGGKLECWALDREEAVPSAVVYTVPDGKFQAGKYYDSGSGEKAIHLVELAVKRGKFAKWGFAIKHYAELAGVALGPVRESKGRYLEISYDYHNAAGNAVYRVNRYITVGADKTFTQHPLDSGGRVKWDASMADVAPLPYRLPHFAAAENDFLYVTEGEKACEALVSLGLYATTAHGGSGAAAKVWPAIAPHFAGRDVVVLPDNDVAGRKVRDLICLSLATIASSVRVLDLPGLPPKGDAVEWIEAGGSAAQLDELAEWCPLWDPKQINPVAADDAALGLPPAPDDLPDDADIELICMADIEPVEVRWLWPDVIPFGKLTQFGGEPKLGKSFLTTWLAAGVSTAGEIPGRGGECFPLGSVIFLSAEDDKADTIRPRLDACGANCRRVHVLNTVRGKDGKFGPFTLAYIAHLERAVLRLGDVKLIVIDPITHYATAGFDDHKSTQVRQLLEPLRSLAEKYDIAVVFVHHFNKGNGTKALNRFSGSGAYGALARSNWVIIKDQDDPKRRLFLSAGCNLVEEPSGLAYRIDRNLKRVVFEDEVLTITADDALEASMARKGDEESVKRVTKVDELAALVRDRLLAGQSLIHLIRREFCEERDFNPNTLYPAFRKLGVTFGVSSTGKKTVTLPVQPDVIPMNDHLTT